MKKVIFILVTIALQIFYYLSITEVIGVNVFGSFWWRFLVAMSTWFVGCIVADSSTLPIRKRIYSIVYLLVLASGIVVYLNLSGVYLGAYTCAIVFMTVFPLSYGAYIYCRAAKGNDAWRIIPNTEIEQPLIAVKLECRSE